MPRAKIPARNPETFNQQKAELLANFQQSRLTIGQATKEMRMLLGMTQTEYGEKVVGLTRKAVSAIENDQHNAEFKTLQKIAKPFELAVGFVLAR